MKPPQASSLSKKNIGNKQNGHTGNATAAGAQISTFQPNDDNYDGKSTYSRISKISKFTNNLCNKSTNRINDQWYQFIYNNDLLNDTESDAYISDNKSQGNISKFTLHSKLSNAAKSNISRISQLQNQYLQQNKTLNDASNILQKQKATQNAQAKKNERQQRKKPLQLLQDLIESIDICRFIRINWLLAPMIDSRSVKMRLFNFNYHQVQDLIQQLEDCPVKKAICLYLSDDLFECMKICQKCRSLSLAEKKMNIKAKQQQFDTYQMVKIYVIELSCLIDILKQDDLTDTKRTQYIQKAHEILEEIPMLVKNRN